MGADRSCWRSKEGGWHVRIVLDPKHPAERSKHPSRPRVGFNQGDHRGIGEQVPNLRSQPCRFWRGADQPSKPARQPRRSRCGRRRGGPGSRASRRRCLTGLHPFDEAIEAGDQAVQVRPEKQDRRRQRPTLAGPCRGGPADAAHNHPKPFGHGGQAGPIRGYGVHNAFKTHYASDVKSNLSHARRRDLVAGVLQDAPRPVPAAMKAPSPARRPLSAASAFDQDR